MTCTSGENEGSAHGRLFGNAIGEEAGSEGREQSRARRSAGRLRGSHRAGTERADIRHDRLRDHRHRSRLRDSTRGAAHPSVRLSAQGPVPRLVETIAGEALVGNWWSHPRANSIYNTFSEVQASDQVLVCRLVNGKVTLVHRRLWASLARLAGRFAPRQVARINEEHTPSGRHVMREAPFPEWVPDAIMRQATDMTEQEAMAQLGRWLPQADGRCAKARR